MSIEIPESFRKKLDEMTKNISCEALKKASFALSSSYREQSEGKRKKTPYMGKSMDKIAYIAHRMPSTLASSMKVFSQLQKHEFDLLDFGSGPGTVLFALLSLGNRVRKATLVEQDEELFKMSLKMLSGAIDETLLQFKKDLEAVEGVFSLVTASYALSELREEQLVEVLNRLFDLSSDTIALIESGTPYGFSTLLKARELYIARGASIIAPCTHESACPMANSSQFCHFSARFDRPKIQKMLKEGALGYEDEKYSYLIVSKLPAARKTYRVVKTPVKHTGHLDLVLCGKEGLRRVVVSKKMGPFYKEAKALAWGDDCTDSFVSA